MLLVVILVLLFWTLWFAGPYIRRWLMRRSINYMQDHVYRSMGLDPEQMRRASSPFGENRQSGSQRRRSGRGADSRIKSHKIIPPDYGEAVSYEILQITGSEKWLIDTDKSPVHYEYRKEQQITDVRYVIIH